MNDLSRLRLAAVDAAWDETERAALVALLRARPNGMTWSEITAQVDARASALALLHELHPADLFDDGGEPPGLAEARADVSGWDAGNLGMLTFRDPHYPAQLREIHEMPPVLFHRGSLVPDDVAMSVVGSRRASSATSPPSSRTA